MDALDMYTDSLTAVEFQRVGCDSDWFGETAWDDMPSVETLCPRDLQSTASTRGTAAALHDTQGIGQSVGQSASNTPRPLNRQRKHDRWSPEDDQQLIKAVERYGDDYWPRIAFGRRTAVQCYHRWFYLQRKIYARREWTDAENDRLLEAAIKYEESDWARIAHDTNRHRAIDDCMTQYYDVLVPRLQTRFYYWAQ
jgi:hypothetical protein